MSQMLSLDMRPNAVSVGVATQNYINIFAALHYYTESYNCTQHYRFPPGPRYLESSVRVLTRFYEMSKLAKYATPSPARTQSLQDDHS